jgi:surfactin family lipopeptide synthetase C
VMEQSHYALHVIVIPEPQLSLKIAYDARRFDAVTIEQMLNRFETLLVEIGKNAERRVREVSPLTDEEAQLLIHAFNDAVE